MHHLAVIAAADFITAVPSTYSRQCNSKEKLRLIRIAHSFADTFDTRDFVRHSRRVLHINCD